VGKDYVLSEIERMLDNLAGSHSYEPVQVKEIIPVEEWVESSYYSGPVCRMYDFWKGKIVEVFRRGINEVIVIGSIGGGKTTFANALLMRKLYELSCYKNPEALFRMLVGTRIAFMYFTVTLRQAAWTGFAMLRDMLDATPYFRDEYVRDREVNSEIRFPKMSVYTGSEFTHQLGLALLGAVLDEANFLKAKDPLEKARTLYTAIIERRKSRFVVDGKDRGLSVLVSSAEELSSFVEERIRRVSGLDDVLVVSVVGYELKRHHYSSDSFVVFVGTEFCRPRIVDTVEDLVEVLGWFKVSSGVIEEVRKYPVKYSVKNVVPLEYRGYFKEVPVDFRRAFEEDIYRALKDVLGVSVGGENKLFRSMLAYDEALVQKPKFFKDDVVQLSNKDDIRLQDMFRLDLVVDRDVPRYVHVDLGIKGDRTGMACAKVVGIKKADLGDLPIVEVEWMVGIEPNRRYVDDEVPLWKVREFLVWLKDSGINVVKVTFDSFQSVDMIQLLQRRGFQVDKLSVDRTDEVYRNLVTLYLERRIKHVENAVYRRELFGLEWDGKKVDHPAGGSKDVADAVAGAVYMACKEWKQGQYELMSQPDVFEEKMEEWWYDRRWDDYRVSGWEEFFRKWGKRGGGWEGGGVS
jgi:hypothetical protein